MMLFPSDYMMIACFFQAQKSDAAIIVAPDFMFAYNDFKWYTCDPYTDSFSRGRYMVFYEVIFLKNKTILASTILVALASISVRFFGYLREVTLAATYGAGMVSDAFIIAFTVPSIVLVLFGATTATVFIPAYSGVERDKSRFMSNVLTLLVLIGFLFTAIFTIFPQSLVFLFASQLDGAAFSLATELLRIMVWVAVPTLVVGILQSYLQIKNAFFLASILIIPINVYAILSILLSGSLGQYSIMGYGVVAGNFMALIVLYTAVYFKGYVYKPVVDLKMPGLRGLLVLIAPIMITTFISDINLIVDRNFASSLASGTISSLNYAGKTVNILITILGVSLATVLYPRMSEFAANNNIAEIRRCVTGCIKMLIPVLLPATLGIILLAEPIVRIIFERGEFTQENTQMAMESLRMYAPLLFSSSINAIIIRAFFSMRDTKTPAIISAVGVAVSIGINFILIGPLAHMGLALSTSISSMLAMVLLLFTLRKRVGLLQLKRNIREWVKVLVATAVMGLVVTLGYVFLPVMGGGTIQCILLTGGLVVAGIGVYILMNLAMRTVFISESMQLAKSFVAKRRDG